MANRPTSSSLTTSKFAPKFSTQTVASSNLSISTSNPYFVPGAVRLPRHFENTNEEDEILNIRDQRRSRRRRRKRWMKFGKSRSVVWNGGYSGKANNDASFSAGQQHPATLGVRMLKTNILDGQLKYIDSIGNNPYIHPASYVTCAHEKGTNPLIGANSNDVCRWLKANGLEVFVEYCDEQELDGDILLKITAEDLIEMEEGSKAQQDSLLLAIKRACDLKAPPRKPPNATMLRPVSSSDKYHPHLAKDSLSTQFLTPGENHFHAEYLHPASVSFESSIEPWRLQYSMQTSIINPIFYGQYIDAPPPPRGKPPVVSAVSLTKMRVQWIDPSQPIKDVSDESSPRKKHHKRRKSRRSTKGEMKKTFKDGIKLPTEKVVLSSIAAEAIGWPRVKLGSSKKSKHQKLLENNPTKYDNAADEVNTRNTSATCVYEVNNLPIGLPCDFRVKFRNESGWGVWSKLSLPVRTTNFLKSFVFTSVKIGKQGSLNSAISLAGTRIHRRLTSRYYCGIPKENAIYLSNCKKEKFVEKMITFAWNMGYSARSSQCHLIFYFSVATACCTIKGSLQSFIVFEDTLFDSLDGFKKTSVSFSELAELIKNTNGRRKLVILDICHEKITGFERKMKSGIGSSTTLYGNPHNGAVAKMSTSCGPGVVVFSSCSEPFQPSKAFRKAKARALKRNLPIEDFQPAFAGYATAAELEADFQNRMQYKGSEYFKKVTLEAEKVRMTEMDGVNAKDREEAKKMLARYERARKLMDAAGDYERAEVSEHSSDSQNELLATSKEKKSKEKTKKKKKKLKKKPIEVPKKKKGEGNKDGDSDSDWEEDRIKKAKAAAKAAKEKAEQDAIDAKEAKKKAAKEKKKAEANEIKRQQRREARLRMLPGWQSKIDSEGCVVYVNNMTGERRYVRPLVEDAVKVSVFSFFLLKGLASDTDSPVKSRLGIDCKLLCDFVTENTTTAAKSVIAASVSHAITLKKLKQKKKKKNKEPEHKKDPTLVGASQQRPCIFYLPLSGLKIKYQLQANENERIALKADAASSMAKLAEEYASAEAAAEAKYLAEVESKNKQEQQKQKKKKNKKTEVPGFADVAEKNACVAAQIAAEVAAEAEAAEKALVEAAVKAKERAEKNESDEEYSEEEKQDVKPSKGAALPIAQWHVWLRGELCDEAKLKPPEVKSKSLFSGHMGRILDVTQKTAQMSTSANVQTPNLAKPSFITHRSVRVIEPDLVADHPEELSEEIVDFKGPTMEKTIEKKAGSAFWPSSETWVDIRIGILKTPHPKEVPKKGEHALKHTLSSIVDLQKSSNTENTNTNTTQQRAKLAGASAFLRVTAKARKDNYTKLSSDTVEEKKKEIDALKNTVEHDALNQGIRVGEVGANKTSKKNRKEEKTKLTFSQRAEQIRVKALALKAKGESLAAIAMKAKEEYIARKSMPEEEKQKILEDQAVEMAVTGNAPPPSQMQLAKAKFKAVAAMAAKTAQAKLKTQMKERLGVDLNELIEKIPSQLRPSSRAGNDTDEEKDDDKNKMRKNANVVADAVAERLASLVRGEGNKEEVAKDLSRRKNRKPKTQLEEVALLEAEIERMNNGDGQEIHKKHSKRGGRDAEADAAASAVLANAVKHKKRKVPKIMQRAMEVQQMRTLKKGSPVDLKCTMSFPVCCLPLAPPAPRNIRALCSTHSSITIEWENPADLDWFEAVDEAKKNQRLARSNQKKNNRTSKMKPKSKEAKMIEKKRMEEAIKNEAKPAEKPQWMLDRIAEKEAAEKLKAEAEAKAKAEADRIAEANMTAAQLQKRKGEKEKQQRIEREKQNKQKESERRRANILTPEQKHVYELAEVARKVLTKDIDNTVPRWKGAPILEFEFQKRGILRGNKNWVAAGTCPGSRRITRITKADKLLADEESYNQLWNLEEKAIRRRNRKISAAKQAMAIGGGPSTMEAKKRRAKMSMSRLEREAEEDALISIASSTSRLEEKRITHTQCVRCLTSGTTFMFRIRARNSGGWSPWSNSSPYCYTEERDTKRKNVRSQMTRELELAAERGGDSIVRKLEQYPCNLQNVQWALGALCAVVGRRDDKWSVLKSRVLKTVLSAMETHKTCPEVASLGSQFICMVWVGDSKYERNLKRDVDLMRYVISSIVQLSKNWTKHPKVNPLIRYAESSTRQCLREHLTYDPAAKQRKAEEKRQKQRERRQIAAEAENERRRKRREKFGASQYSKYATEVRAKTPNEGEELLKRLMM